MDNTGNIDEETLNEYYRIEKENATKYTNILLIDKSIDYEENFMNSYCNDNTFALVYNYNDDRSKIMDIMSYFENIKRIAFAFHGPSSDSTDYGPIMFLNNETLFVLLI